MNIELEVIEVTGTEDVVIEDDLIDVGLVVYRPAQIEFLPQSWPAA